MSEVMVGRPGIATSILPIAGPNVMLSMPDEPAAQSAWVCAPSLALSIASRTEQNVSGFVLSALVVTVIVAAASAGCIVPNTRDVRRIGMAEKLARNMKRRRDMTFSF